MDYFDQIAAGVRPPPPLAMRTEPDRLSSEELELSYAIAKKLPDMVQRGFTIETSYGELVIEPGRHADAIAATVRRSLEIQLKAAELARRDANLDGALA
ncbi:MAG: hypothetical protein KKB95_09545 [Gammaproteobacteria bacterium]|nr:hypothetical protein [Gammaproteobacteria bacterium]MBU1505805.1 hypothetical protein [Gammaproteobacteria bacterium]MBU2119493.1 hypothetical protein [Gammaproteobacteria bacterium]MBU2172601.1 hypothetical protein [Gammaproteobacteria bacterium]MBU2202059.1 hypothetical protein [Gammaproteobacteria bacterium]